MISASLSLSLPRLGWKSTSMPRSLKICTAAGERASEMRTLGIGLSTCGLAPAAVITRQDGDPVLTVARDQNDPRGLLDAGMTSEYWRPRWALVRPPSAE